jgi:hypothetical protein
LDRLLKLWWVMFYMPAGLFIFLALCGFVGLIPAIRNQSLPQAEIWGQIIVAYLLLGIAAWWCKLVDLVFPEFD